MPCILMKFTSFTHLRSKRFDSADIMSSGVSSDDTRVGFDVLTARTMNSTIFLDVQCV
jgi:hypothetical protein